MKQFLIQVAMMAVVFLLLWMVAPLLMTNIAQWPAWMKDSNVQFITSLLLSLIAAFNPVTGSVIKNSIRIKGDYNQVIQGKVSAKTSDSEHNSATIEGYHNKVKQG